MAQMFSSGVTPDYLQALSDAYAQYFPQQAPVNTQALQQWYSPQGGSSAFAAPMGAAAPSSVVGSLFGEQYPQVHQGGGGNHQIGQGMDVGVVGEGKGFSGNFSGLGAGLRALGNMGIFGPFGKLAALAYGAYDAYNNASPDGGGGDRGGVATGGNGGDASGGGDRGTRGGW